MPRVSQQPSSHKAVGFASSMPFFSAHSINASASSSTSQRPGFFSASLFVQQSAASLLLQSAALSQRNEEASPLIRDIERARQSLSRAAAADDPSDEHAQTVKTTALSLRELLARYTSAVPPLSPALSYCFPDLDSLLSALVLQRQSFSAVVVELVDCCAVLLTACASTEADARSKFWPRWLSSDPSKPSKDDAALYDFVTSRLSPQSSSAVSSDDVAVRLSCIGFLAALSSSSSFEISHAAQWLLRPELWRALLSLYRAEADEFGKRVTELAQRGAVRLLLTIFATTAGCEELKHEADADSVDCHRFLLLQRAVTVVGSVVRARCHDKQQPRCELCTDIPFDSLVNVANTLWTALVPAMRLFPRPLSATSSSASLCRRDAVLSFLCSTLSPVTQCFAHCDFVSAYAATACAAVPSSFPVSSVVQWHELATNVALFLHDLCSDATGNAVSTQQLCAALLGIADSIKATMIAGRSQSVSRLTTASVAATSSSASAAGEAHMSLLRLMDALLHSARTLLPPSGAAGSNLSAEQERCLTRLLGAYLRQFIHHKSNAALCPVLLATACSSFLPLVAAVLSLPAVGVDSLMAVFAVLATLLRAVDTDEQRVAVLSCAVRCGVVDRSWWVMEGLLAGAVGPQDHTTQKSCRQWLAGVFSSVRWWRSELSASQWEERLARSYGQPGCWQRRIVRLHQLEADGREATERCQELETALSLCSLFLVCRGVRRREQGDEHWAGVELDGKAIASSIQQLLLAQLQQQEHALRADDQLSKALLLRLCFVAMLLEDELRVFVSSRAKAALFSLLVSAAVAIEDVALNVCFQSHVTATSLSHWCWRQNAPALHDQLLTSCFSSAADEQRHDDSDFVMDAADGGVSHTRPQQDLGRVAALLLGEGSAVLALVRRWKSLALRSSHQDGAAAAGTSELFHLTHRLLDEDRSEQVIAAGVVEPLTALLNMSSTVPPLCLPLLGLLRGILTAPSPAAMLVDRAFRSAAMQAACRSLLSHDPSEDSAAVDMERLRAQLLCMQVINAVLQCEHKERGEAEDALHVLVGDSAIASSIESLARHGQLLESSASSSDSSNAIRRVQLDRPTASGSASGVTAEQAEQLRLQLQVATLQLSASLMQSIVAASEQDAAGALAERWYVGLLTMVDSAVLALAHRCEEVKLAALHYLVAFFSLDAVALSEKDASESEDEDRLYVGFSSLRQLLLFIQAFVLPHYSAALSLVALDLLSALLSAAPSSVQQRLRRQPWHSFVIQSLLFALRSGSSSPAVASTGKQSNAVGMLLRYLHLLVEDDGSPAGAAGDSGCCDDGDRDDGDRCIVRRHLQHVDNRLLLPLMFFSALADNPEARAAVYSPSYPAICISSLHRFVCALCHIHHAQRMPLKAVAQLPAHLRAILGYLRHVASQQPSALSTAIPAPLLCPASSRPMPRSPTAAAALSSSQRGNGTANGDWLSQSSPAPSQPLSQLPATTSAPAGPVPVAVLPGASKTADKSDVVLCLCAPLSRGDVLLDVRRVLTCTEKRATTLLSALTLAPEGGAA